MAQAFHPGQIVPQSGVYRVTHDPVHAAQHVSEVETLHEPATAA